MEIKTERLFQEIYKPLGVPIHIYGLFYHTLGHIIPLLIILNGNISFCIGAIVFEIIYGYMGALGITVGCHRYWTHKTFKANLSLQILLMIFQTIASELTIHKWCLEHRMHHKYMDTDADPHNSKKGFWYSHVGWLCSPKSKEFLEKVNVINMSDLESDPVVRFQARWFWLLMLIFSQTIPAFVVCYFWKLSLLDAIVYGLVRHITFLHITYSINSIAHKWGDKPYDSSISAVENQMLSTFAAGEGWHNYHHTFPWDYKASEFGWKANFSTMFIDFFAKIGWASELKTVSPEQIERRRNRTGNDVSKDNSMQEAYWGWDDPSMPDDLRSATKISYRQKKG